MDRINRLQAHLVQQELDALLVRETPNIAYLTGFEGVFDEERAHALLVTQTAAVLHTDSRYFNACLQAAHEQGDGIQIDGDATTHAAWLAKQIQGITLGIEDTVSLAEFHKLEEALDEKAASVALAETWNVVVGLRKVKDVSEVVRLHAAQAITDAAFAYIKDFVRPGMTERMVQRELDNYMYMHGAEALAFPSIVATGAHGANPHAQPTDAKLEAGQCVVMDFGARAHGYCSDMTRMLFIGQPSQRLKDAYSTLREANETVEAALMPGITGAQAHQMALDVLEAGGFGGLMGHGLGHGVGLEIHEDPMLSPRNSEALQAGNVVTVEPGIYVPGEFGMRLEDFGIVTESGFEVFTKSSHDLVVV